MKIKPIKRSSYLAPLSREHHDGLLFCWKIKQGLKLKIGTERIMNYCEWFFENHLKQHFKQEGEQLSKIFPPHHPLLETMFEDHEAIRKNFEELVDYAPDDHLIRFADIITYHIQFEERQLFNIVEKIATPEQLNDIFQNLNTEKTENNSWDDEFWLMSTSASKPKHSMSEH